MLLDVSSQMKRVIRAIESIPLHLTLDIVRLDDALGESWALPFQACTTWNVRCDKSLPTYQRLTFQKSFRNLLQVVVYSNGRPGAQKILYDQFVILSAKTGNIITPAQWGHAMKAGIHVHQAMVTPELSREKESCPYPSCNGSITKESDVNNVKVWFVIPGQMTCSCLLLLYCLLTGK